MSSGSSRLMISMSRRTESFVSPGNPMMYPAQMIAPCSRHFCSISRYSVILFWCFLLPIRLSGLMFSSPIKHAANPGSRRLFDEIRDAVAKRVDLDREADRQPFVDPQSDHPIEQRFPITVASEIVVGDEEALDASCIVFPDCALEVVGSAEPAFAALDIDDRAERALIRTAPPQIEAGQRTRNPPDVPR